MVTHAPLLNTFYEKQVDKNANKLVLAVFCYKESDWFVICSNISNFFYTKVCLHIKFLLWIDEYKDTDYPGGTSWKTCKIQFFKILDTLKELGEEKGHTAKDRLVSKVANNIETAIRRQLMMMKFYQDEELDDTPQFDSVGNYLKKSGGAVNCIK